MDTSKNVLYLTSDRGDGIYDVSPARMRKMVSMIKLTIMGTDYTAYPNVNEESEPIARGVMDQMMMMMML